MQRLVLVTFLFLTSLVHADHLIVAGGPSLLKWEHLRVKEDQHDRWWANFIRASTVRIDEIRKAYGPNTPVVWMVHKPSYVSRGKEDGKPYISWITEQATKRKTTLIWFDTSGDFMRKLNARPRGSVETFDFFGHSNRYAFMFDYGNEIMAASTSWLHENDLSRVKSSIFARDAYCKSWGCHTGESMSKVWRRTVGIPLEGAAGPTSYVNVGKEGTLPKVRGGWVR